MNQPVLNIVHMFTTPGLHPGTTAPFRRDWSVEVDYHSTNLWLICTGNICNMTLIYDMVIFMVYLAIIFGLYLHFERLRIQNARHGLTAQVGGSVK